MNALQVLVVDDSIADFGLIDISMREAMGTKVELEHAPSIEKAADMIRDKQYAAIFQDLYLPPHGPESITEIYKIAGRTPIVAISGQSSPEMHRMAVANGASLFCSKSNLDSENLVSILAQVIPEIGPPGQ